MSGRSFESPGNALRCVASRCVALRRVASRCVALRYVVLRCVALRCVALRCVGGCWVCRQLRQNICQASGLFAGVHERGAVDEGQRSHDDRQRGEPSCDGSVGVAYWCSVLLCCCEIVVAVGLVLLLVLLFVVTRVCVPCSSTLCSLALVLTMIL